MAISNQYKQVVQVPLEKKVWRALKEINEQNYVTMAELSRQATASFLREMHEAEEEGFVNWFYETCQKNKEFLETIPEEEKET